MGIQLKTIENSREESHRIKAKEVKYACRLDSQNHGIKTVIK